MKKHLMFKRCDEKCPIYKEYVHKKMHTNNACISCMHKSTMDQMIDERFANIDNNKFCKYVDEYKRIGTPVFKHNMCEGYVTDDRDTPASFCAKCKWYVENAIYDNREKYHLWTEGK